jgi:hypothetical protein
MYNHEINERSETVMNIDQVLVALGRPQLTIIIIIIIIAS